MRSDCDAYSHRNAASREISKYPLQKKHSTQTRKGNTPTMHPIVLSSSRRGPLFPPLPEDPVSDSSLRESEIISHDSSSSDDETEKAAKRRRMLKHAESYLRGEPLYLHSARLRGPVVKNPWGKAAGQAKRKDGETEGGGIRKRLKRFSIGEEDGREIQTKKGKGILTSRGTNTIDDVVPEPSTPTRVRTRRLAAANVPERSLSHSPVSRIKSVRNRTLELDKHDSGLNVPKQTDDEFTMALYKTPGKKRPERGPIEVPPACSPGTFYSRSKPSQINYSSSQETRGSGTKSKPSTSVRKSSARKTPARKPSAQKDSKEQVDLVSDVIVLAIPAPPFPDVDLKKKRLKIDFAAKSPFVGPAAERTKPPKGRRKKKLSIGKENVPGAEKRGSGSIPVEDSISLAVLEKGVERAEDTSKDTTEQVLNDWLNKHVAASRGVQLRGVVSRNASIANPPLNQAENLDPTMYEIQKFMKALQVLTDADMVPMAGPQLHQLHQYLYLITLPLLRKLLKLQKFRQCYWKFHSDLQVWPSRRIRPEHYLFPILQPLNPHSRYQKSHEFLFHLILSERPYLILLPAICNSQKPTRKFNRGQPSPPPSFLPAPELRNRYSPKLPLGKTRNTSSWQRKGAFSTPYKTLQ